MLANHVPILARVRPADLRLHMPDGETRHFAQAEGWLEVFANRALLLVGWSLSRWTWWPQLSGPLRPALAGALLALVVAYLVVLEPPSQQKFVYFQF